MKILFLTNLYPPNVFGGYERLCYEVATGLQSRGHEVTVLTSSYGQYHGEAYGHTVRRELFLFANEENIYGPFDCSPAQREEHEASNQRMFMDAIDTVKPHVLFVWNLYFFDNRLLSAIEKCSLPKMYLLTDNWMIVMLNSQFIKNRCTNTTLDRDQKHDDFKHKLHRLIKPISRLFDHDSIVLNGRAIFSSKFMRDYYRDAGFYFKRGENICYHGVRFLHVPGVKRVSRIALEKTTIVRLLFAGRVVKTKGVHTAIEAVHEMRKRYCNLRIVLTIVGETQDQEYCREIELLIDSLGLRELILFQPAVAESELFNLFQNHDIYLFPSLYEPFSLTLIHALESGIPTIASDVGGNIEMINNEKTGLIFRAGDYNDLADKINMLITKSSLRERLSQRAVAHASKFTFNKMILRIETDLNKVVKLKLRLP